MIRRLVSRPGIEVEFKVKVEPADENRGQIRIIHLGISVRQKPSHKIKKKRKTEDSHRLLNPTMHFNPVFSFAAKSTGSESRGLMEIGFSRRTCYIVIS
jgi:hypothetical protein